MLLPLLQLLCACVRACVCVWGGGGGGGGVCRCLGVVDCGWLGVKCLSIDVCIYSCNLLFFFRIVMLMLIMYSAASS